MAKIIKSCEIEKNRYLWQKNKAVLVGGCFDLLHFGHFRFLQEAKKRGDYLIVLLESDQFIKEKKRREPVHNQKERAEILSNLNFIDLVVLLTDLKNDNQYSDLVEIIKPKVIALSQKDAFYKNKKNQAKRVGASLEVVTPLIKKFSSTKIINYESVSGD